jgi:hypothetical protein
MNPEFIDNMFIDKMAETFIAGLNLKMHVYGAD